MWPLFETNPCSVSCKSRNETGVSTPARWKLHDPPRAEKKQLCTNRLITTASPLPAACSCENLKIMAGLIWMITFLCGAGCHLSPSAALRSPLVVHAGQNVSLTCNITSTSPEVIWYVLHSDQLLPLLRVSQTKLKGGGAIGNVYAKNSSRVSWTTEQKDGLVSLEILAVEEEDAGLYFCSGLCGSNVCVNRVTHLKVKGVDVNSSGGKVRPPCWSLGICFLPVSLALCCFVMIGFYLCSGKLVCCCCCKPLRRGSGCRVTGEESLHYSSLRHPVKPHPSNREGPRPVEDLVIYSTVPSRKN